MKQLLIIGYVWPEPQSSAAGTRMMELIELFKSHDYAITFASPAQLSDHMADLASIDVSAVNIELNNESFDTFVHELAPDVVMYDRFMMEEQF
ncbi:MAG: glycosyltransferase, partial [Psychrobium sp.]